MAGTDAPALLVVADFYGTLSAARCLGRKGIRVVVADWRLLPAARWSRYATSKVTCPPPHEVGRFVAWLLEFGAAQPGHILYPTSDDTAWLYANRAAELSEFFRLYQPPAATIERLLDKSLLLETCRLSGIDTPRTYSPQGLRELPEIAEQASFPLLIKPRTQVLSSTHAKGRVVRRREELGATYARYLAQHGYAPELVDRLPAMTFPLLQAYHQEATDSIYCVSGFIDRSGSLTAFRFARKVLQRPRGLGIGVCFEGAAPNAELARKVTALCQEVGYFGVFEAEFIHVDGRALLIDFNPRYYGQMEFDSARGLPLPLLVQCAALEDEEALTAEITNAQIPLTNPELVYRDRVGFFVVACAQLLSRKSGRDERTRWRKWSREHRGRVVDASYARDDPLPVIFNALRQGLALGRHPRAFIRQVVLDR
jgi:D-aspartate ligase